MDVHRAARIAAAGHGGQVLLSQTARELVGDDLSTEYALLDLGEHVLKDLTRPQRIFQLVAEGIDRDFPPLSTLASRPTNLPPQATPLIGRERELAEVAAVLGRTDVRVLTLDGARWCREDAHRSARGGRAARRVPSRSFLRRPGAGHGSSTCRAGDRPDAEREGGSRAVVAGGGRRVHQGARAAARARQFRARHRGRAET